MDNKEEDVLRTEQTPAEGGEGKTPREAYDEAWDADAVDDVKGDDDVKGTPAEDASEGGEDPHSEGPKSPVHGPLESIEKALHDTRSYANRLLVANQALEQRVAELEAGKATKQDVEDQRKVAEAAAADLDQAKEKVYEDYPELRAILDPMLDRHKALEVALEEMRSNASKSLEEDRRRQALAVFERDVLPVVEMEHPDFRQIVKQEAYWQWAEKQSPAIRFAATDSADPEDIKLAVRLFKRDAATPQAAEERRRQEGERRKKIENARALRGAASAFPGARSTTDPKDYNAGWDEAGEQLKREGIVAR